MKKMILGLALCLGLSQVAVAQKDLGLAQLTEKETKGAIAWIKNNPKKAAAIGAAITAALTYSGFAIAATVKNADKKEGFWARGAAGAAQPAKSAWNKTVAGKDWAVKNVKALPIWADVSAAVVIVIAAAVIADFATTDKEAEMRITKALKKLLKKASKEEVVASN
jgi:hypothetical protein